MKSEVEAKFLDVDHDKLRTRLEELGATLEQPMRLIRRVLIETPELVTKSAFLRVRDEGHRTTLTYKQFNDISFDGANEVEIIVDDFNKTIELLALVGLPYQSYQESRRETWRLGAAEIVLDEWPWLAPYLEIEADDESTVRAVANQLGFDWESAVFGDVMAAYRKEYSHLSESDTVAHLPEVKFDDPMPDMLVP